MVRAALVSALLLSLAPASPALAAQGHAGKPLDTKAIVRLTGGQGKMNVAEGVLKVSVPRTDLKPTVSGVKVTPPLGLTSWAAFMPAGRQAMVMGDMVLAEDQVNPVMSVALDNGLEVTALHNHFLADSPRVMFMHIGGTGDQIKLAAAVGKVFAKMKETAGGEGALASADIDAGASAISPKPIEAILGKKAEVKDGTVKVVFGRTTYENGHAVGNTMGVNTWAAFAGSDQKAVVDGDFVVREKELQPVLKALRKAKIDIVAIHQHMTFETPRMIFLHYWGIGPAADLARGVKAALALTK